MNGADREAAVKLILAQMRERLASLTQDNQRDTTAAIIFLSGVVTAMSKTPALDDPTAYMRLLPEGQGPEMSVGQIAAMEALVILNQ